MNILALETATDACSVALLSGSKCVECHQVAPRRHIELIFDMLEGVLHEVGLEKEAIDLVAFGRGPGSFTGVRIAASIAQGISLARALPVAPVSTLLALAAGGARLFGASHVVAMMDARRDEIYVAAFEIDAEEDAIQAVVSESVIRPEMLSLPSTAEWIAVGDGWEPHSRHIQTDEMRIRPSTLTHPHAQDVGRLAAKMHQSGQTVGASGANPIYLRGSLT